MDLHEFLKLCKDTRVKICSYRVAPYGLDLAIGAAL